MSRLLWVLVLCVWSVSASAQVPLPSDPRVYWTNRGGLPMQTWCLVGLAAYETQTEYGWPGQPNGPKISIFVVEHWENAVLLWRLRYGADKKIWYWGPVPYTEERKFEAIVAYYRQQCGQ